jgi:hypothetical protein
LEARPGEAENFFQTPDRLETSNGENGRGRPSDAAVKEKRRTESDHSAA